jgi:hypothetical protein
VVTPRLQIDEDAITTSLYSVTNRYAFDQPLFVYRPGESGLVQLTDAPTVRGYFQAVDPTLGASCPLGHEGQGVSVF